MKMGTSLPLRHEPIPAGPSSEEGKREDIRILLYWGCGEGVRSGQPRVIDTAKMTAEDYTHVVVVRGGGSSSRLRLSPRKGWTYGEWPNRDSRRDVPNDSSLVGEHLIKGNYTPDIKFALDARRDFMAPDEFTRAEGGLKDPIKLEWKVIPHRHRLLHDGNGGRRLGARIRHLELERAAGHGRRPAGLSV